MDRQTNRQTERQNRLTKLIVAFRNAPYAPKNWLMLLIDLVAVYPEDHGKQFPAPQSKVLFKGVVHFLSQRLKWQQRDLNIDV
jgi:hypothetical protein